MAEYSFLDRVLHRLALQATPLAELSFDLDQKSAKADPAAAKTERHVFVSGLARAGTTVLMRQFYATGAFRSLTYRDMPFVLAPNLWRKLAGASKKELAAAERAHGDRILVDADSPESLDEVFWRIFAGDEYIAADHLRPHTPDAETRDRFVKYVSAILAAQDGDAPRYLSKNNNNILRLAAVRAAFPNALIVVPFRDPISHAGSLLRMHREFGDMQGDDAFVKSYMTWLAHHEFGHDHRPFKFGDALPSGSPDSLDYWLSLWRNAYRWLETSAPEDAIFVCYEDLCADPGVWRGLAEKAGLADKAEEGETFSLSTRKADAPEDATLATEAAEIYERLRERSRDAAA